MTQLSAYNVGPVKYRSMPIWCAANPLVDPFGENVLPPLPPLETCGIIVWAAKQGLIEATGLHDDDIVKWDPKNPYDDLDEGSQTYETISQIEEMFSGAGIIVNTVTCNLHAKRIFRNGGLTNPDADIRKLGILKVKRAVRIGNRLGARYLTYWVARDGWMVAVKVPWEMVYEFIAEGLNGAYDYIVENNFTNYVGGTIEPKPSEPPGHTFIPTSGHAVAFILEKLRNPGFWGVNPELLQHEAMTLLDPVTCIGFLVAMKKLSFLHFGNQLRAEFDNDNPPLVGPEGLKETALMFWELGKLGWEGPVEFDCHMLREEGNPDDPIGCRKEFIEVSSIALQTALELALRIKESKTDECSASEADLRATCGMCGLDYNEMAKRARKT